MQMLDWIKEIISTSIWDIWTRNNIKSIVTNELYYKDEYIYAKNSKFDFVKPVSIKKEPIISRDIFLKAKKQLAANRSNYNNLVKTIYI